MLYEIINPSDKYTMEAEDFKLAACANILISEGAYGLEPEGGGEPSMPILLFGGASEWVSSNICPIAELTAFIDKNALEIAKILDSVLIGSLAERKTYLRGLEMADTPEKKKKWRDAWHDERRSSMNDIGSFAWRRAERLRKLDAEHKAKAKTEETCSK